MTTSTQSQADRSLDILGNPVASLLESAFIDLSRASLEIARKYDLSQTDEVKVLFRAANAAKSELDKKLKRWQEELRAAVGNMPIDLGDEVNQ